MTAFRSCTGCTFQSQPCEARDTLRLQLKGIGVTSIKWRCKSRRPRFEAGDPVWALTVSGYTSHGEGEPSRDRFPATVIKVTAAKALVFIAPGAEGEGHDSTFEPQNSSGFCKLPLSRLSTRDGQREEVCRFCQLPASRGHVVGYSCSPATWEGY